MLNRLADRQRRWVAEIATALVVLAIALLAMPSTSAQESGLSGRFYGFNGDITIDGEPVGPGAEIVAFKGDEEIGRAKVNQAGAWFLEYDALYFAGGPCDVTFLIGDVRTTPGWDSCEVRVSLVLLTKGGDESEQDELEEGDVSTEGVDDDQAEVTDDADNGSDLLEEDAEEVTDDADLMEEDGDEVSEGTEDSTTEQVGDGDDGSEESTTEVREIIRPSTPLTGSGSLAPSDQMPNWARAASITALLIFVIAVVALIFARRTDGSV